jgi:hypothetical protein
MKREIEQAEKPTCAEVMGMVAAQVDNGNLLNNVIFNVAVEEHEIGYTDTNILIDLYSIDDRLHFGIPGGCEDYGKEGDYMD